MEDPFQFAESLDGKTMEYADEQTRRFKENYGKVSEHILAEGREYTQTKRVLQAITIGQHLALLYSAGAEHFVSIDGEILYSSRKVITWISLSDDCRRLALFETTGSDFGKLKIYVEGKLAEEIDGNIKQLVFTETSFYLVKTFSKEKSPDGGEPNSHRIVLDGSIVFGTGLKSTEFIEAHKSGNQIMITVGDWNHASIYLGNLEDPGTWHKEYTIDSPVTLVGIVDGEACYLEKDGNGIIKKGTSALIEGKSTIENCVLVKEGFLVFHLDDAKILPVLYDFSGREIKEFRFESPMGLFAVQSDETCAVVNLESFGVPFSLFRYESLQMTKLEENKLMDLAVQEKFVDSQGTRVHYFLVHPVSSKRKVAVAYGYGGFNISLSPKYSPLFALLLKNGIYVAQANLRGGGEYGKEWHLAGMREKKQNVFDDFVAVISELKAENFKVVAMGESNGGLLTGAVLTQNHTLLDGAVIGVPVLDMMRFHTMSVGKYWITEYGDPDNPADAEILGKYSPYHNLKEQAYPKTLIYSRMKDDRVHPGHAIKFHMSLNQYSDNSYLRLGRSGGHAGIELSEKTGEICENFNFIADCLGMSRENALGRVS